MIAQLQHCLWLADTILSAGRITRPEIDRRWAYSSLNENHESVINERTFHRWRQGAESLLNILIECNRHSGYTYYIANAEAIRNDQSKRWLLDSFAMSGLMQDASLRPYVLLEEMPSDSQFLTPIMDAIRNRKVISISYKSFKDLEAHLFTMHVYCVKTFKRRWYMVGQSSDHPNEIRVYSLDRIQSLQLIDQSYEIPTTFDPRTYFKDYYGIFRNEQPTRIVIEMDKEEAKFLRTLPLHASQKEIPMGEDSPTVRLEFFLAPTFDFIQELRTFGASLKILEPMSLAEKFKDLGQKYLELYK